MKTTSIWNLLIGALVLTLFSACGGGGGGGGSVTLTQPTSAVLTLSTAVTGTIPANTTTINIYDVTISLPAGVTIKATPDSINPAKLVPDSGVVTDNPAGSYIEPVYSAATSTLPGTVKVYIVSATGFDPGAFCKVNADIAAGHYPKVSDFQQPTSAANGYLHTHLGYLDDLTTDVDLTNQLSLTATVVIN